MNKGNRKAQRKRRRIRAKDLPTRQQVKFELIDGNMTYYPSAYCKAHGAFLSIGLEQTHRCDKRHCNSYERLE